MKEPVYFRLLCLKLYSGSKNLVVAYSLGGRVGVGGLWGGRSREEGDNVWLWLEEGERVVVAVG